ncbi:MAG: 3-methyl-2-oxobutanoate dehydrogenase subunit beta, partial [Bacteroidales bacterium]|nr:3-methyl-2-oxobutanoate dehydrogenase subunit beta [Bacteroidales bacterium]
LDLQADSQERHVLHLQEKYREIEANEARCEKINCDDADYILVAYGSSARICQKAMDLLRAEGVKVGLLRPITLWPFPTKDIQSLLPHVKGFMSVEMSLGQMVEDVKLAVEGKVKVEFFGRCGGIVPAPEEVVHAVKTKLL